MVLQLSDFDTAGKQVDVLALINGNNGAIWYADRNRPPAVGSLSAGELGISGTETLISRIWHYADNRLRLQDNDQPMTLALNTYFGPGGAGNDLSITIQDETGAATQVIAGNIERSGGQFVNLEITREMETVADRIDGGGLFILALWRTGNQPPTVAIVTAPATVAGGAEVVLVATASDRDGSIASYAWTASPNVGTFANATSQNTTWTAPAETPAAQPVALTLTVTDDDGATATAMVTITVRAAPVVTTPTASITTAAQTVDAGTAVTLDATARAASGTTVSSTVWTATGGTFSDANILEPDWTAPSPAVETAYTLTLTVTASNGETGTANVVITVRAAAMPPVTPISRTRVPVDQQQTTAPTARNLRRICIDPGHGGRYPGAAGVGGLPEKTIALQVALKLGTYLQGEGQSVLFTRVSDRDVGINRRGDIANDADCGLFVSLHCNASTSEAANGFETLRAHFTEGRPIFGTADDHNLAIAINTSIAAYFPEQRNRGVKHDLPPNTGFETGLGVLRRTKMPAALVELGFITSPSGYAFLTDDDNQDRLAEAIGAGLLGYPTTNVRAPDAVVPRVPTVLRQAPGTPRLVAGTVGPRFLTVGWSAAQAETWEVRWKIDEGEYTAWINAGSQSGSTIAVAPGQTVVVQARATNAEGMGPVGERTWVIPVEQLPRIRLDERLPLRVYQKDKIATITTLPEAQREATPPVSQLTVTDGLADVARTVSLSMVGHVTPPAYVEVVWPDGWVETFQVEGLTQRYAPDETMWSGRGGSQFTPAQQVIRLRTQLETNEAGHVDAAGATAKLTRASATLRRAAAWYRIITPAIGAGEQQHFNELLLAALAPVQDLRNAAQLLFRYGLLLDPDLRLIPIDSPQGVYRPDTVYDGSLQVASPQHALLGRAVIDALPIWVAFDRADDFDPASVMLPVFIDDPVDPRNEDVPASQHPDNPSVYRANGLTGLVGSKRRGQRQGQDHIVAGKAADYADAGVRLLIERLRLLYEGTTLTCTVPGDHNVVPGMRLDLSARGSGNGWLINSVQHVWRGDSAHFEEAGPEHDWDTQLTAGAIRATA